MMSPVKKERQLFNRPLLYEIVSIDVSRILLLISEYFNSILISNWNIVQSFAGFHLAFSGINKLNIVCCFLKWRNYRRVFMHKTIGYTKVLGHANEINAAKDNFTRQFLTFINSVFPAKLCIIYPPDLQRLSKLIIDTFFVFYSRHLRHLGSLVIKKHAPDLPANVLTTAISLAIWKVALRWPHTESC